MPDASAIVNFVLQLLIPVAIAGAIAFVAKGIVPQVAAWIESHVDDKTRQLIDEIITVAVRAANEAQLTAKLRGEALDALAYCVHAAGLLLARYGIDIDEVELVALIRADLARQLERRSWVNADVGAAKSLPTPTLDEHWA